jgi:hypothetical protein
MNLETRYLNVLDYSVEISSGKRILDLIENVAGVILPDVKIQDSEKFNLGSIMVRSSNENRFKKSNKNRFIIEGNYDEKQLAMDSIMLSSRLLESALIEDGFYSFHSSAVSDGECVIILGGSSSSGKTTTALNVCLNLPKILKFYSGDRTVLHESNVMAGTKKIHVRGGSVVYEIPKLQKYIQFEETESPWDTTKLIEPRTIEIEPDIGEREIKCVVYPRRGSHKLKIGRVRDDRAVLRLHDDICHFSDIYPNMILGQREPIDIEIPRKSRKKRIEYILSLSKEIPILTVSGNLNDITKSVISLMLDEEAYEEYLKS